MTTENQHEKLLDKLRKLKAHQESAEKIKSVEEAQAFGEMIQRLVLKHNLSMSDIEFEQHEKDEPIGEQWINWEAQGLKTKSMRIEWEESLASIVARAHFCRILISHSSNRICLVGRKSDAEVAEYVLVTLRRAAKSLAYLAQSQFVKENKASASCQVCLRTKDDHVFESHPFRKTESTKHHGFKNSFLNGFVTRLSERFRQTREDVTSSSTALVRVNRVEQALKDHMSQYGSAKMVRGARRDVNYEGLLRGRKAADDVNLTANAIKSGNPVKQIS
jgi:hypothetical protein